MTQAEIDSFMEDVPDPTRAALARLCRIIEGSDPRVRGEIKWNAPSYAIDDHFATTGILQGGGIRLVLHTGARRKGPRIPLSIDDPDGLLEWKDADRAVVVFADADDVLQHEAAVQAILAEWILQTQRLKS